MKLTKIAVVLAAALTLSALVAPAASAAEYKSTFSPPMLFAEDNGNLQFAVDEQPVTCSILFEKGIFATPTKELTNVTAAYSGCTAFGFENATVNMGNCTYTFKQPNTVEAPKTYTANVGLICSNNSSPVTINTPKVFGSRCSVSISSTANENLEHIVIDNAKSMPLEILDTTFTAKVTGIRVTKNLDEGICPLSGTGTVNNGTLNGSLTVQATNGVGFYVE